MIFENSIRRNARKPNILRCKNTIWVYSIDVDEATRNREMIDDGRIMAFRYLQLLPRTK
jgi:hypothetical protein